MILAALYIHWNWKGVLQAGSMSCLNGTAITIASGHSTRIEYQTEMPTDDTEVSVFSAKASLDT